MSVKNHHIDQCTDKKASIIARELSTNDRYGAIDDYNVALVGGALHLIAQNQPDAEYSHHNGNLTFWFLPGADCATKVSYAQAKAALRAGPILKEKLRDAYLSLIPFSLGDIVLCTREKLGYVGVVVDLMPHTDRHVQVEWQKWPIPSENKNLSITESVDDIEKLLYRHDPINPPEYKACVERRAAEVRDAAQ